MIFRYRGLRLLADRATVTLDKMGIVTATWVGNVRITTRDCRKGVARRAEYRAEDQRIVLSGDARMWPDAGFPRGDDIFIFLRSDSPLDNKCAASNAER